MVRPRRPPPNPEDAAPPVSFGAAGRVDQDERTMRFSNAPVERWGDLFPLPLPGDEGFGRFGFSKV